MSKKNNNKKRKNTLKKVPRISLTMIVKNEEKFLPGCLESVRGFVDEMIIVDTGSTDRTREIAHGYGAKVYDFNWVYDFSKARNFALEKATGDWILWLDADERFPQQARTVLKKIISSGQYDAIVLKLRSEVNGVLGKIPHYQQSPRLFRKMPGVQFEYPVHEQITPSLIRKKAKFVMVDAVIEHLGYAQSEEIIEQKIHRNLELLKKHLEMEPENPYAHYQIAQSFELLQQEEEALNHYYKALEFDRESNLSATIYLHLAAYEVKKKNYEKAIQWAQKSLEMAPEQYTAPNMLGEIYYFLKNYSQAEYYYKKALEFLAIPVAQRKLSILIEKELDMDQVFFKYATSLYLQKKYELLSQEIDLYVTKYNKLPPGITEIISKTFSSLNVREEKWLTAFHAIIHSLGDKVEEKVVLAFLLEEKWFLFRPVVEWLLKVLNENNYSSEILFKAAEMFFNSGNVHYALQIVNRVSEVLQKEPVWQLKGMCEIKMGKWEEAIHTYNVLSQLNPQNISYLKVLGGLYARTGDLDHAAEIIKKMKMEKAM